MRFGFMDSFDKKLEGQRRADLTIKQSKVAKRDRRGHATRKEGLSPLWTRRRHCAEQPHQRARRSSGHAKASRTGRRRNPRVSVLECGDGVCEVTALAGHRTTLEPQRMRTQTFAVAADFFRLRISSSIWRASASGASA
jgi:hypothetical protein